MNLIRSPQPTRWWLALCGLSLLTAGARAQTAPAAAPASRADPTQATAVVPAARYTSSFRTYRGYREEEVGSWKAANDEVTRIGGWRAYAREHASEPAPAPAPATSTPTPAPPPAPAHRH